jgi:hypothetical protein
MLSFDGFRRQAAAAYRRRSCLVRHGLQQRELVNSRRGPRARGLARRAAGLLLLTAAGLIGLVSAHALGDTAAAQVPPPSSTTASATTSATTASPMTTAATEAATTSPSSATTTASSSSSAASAAKDEKKEAKPPDSDKDAKPDSAKDAKKDNSKESLAKDAKAESAKDAKNSKAEPVKDSKDSKDSAGTSSSKDGKSQGPAKDAKAEADKDAKKDVPSTSAGASKGAKDAGQPSGAKSGDEGSKAAETTGNPTRGRTSDSGEAVRSATTDTRAASAAAAPGSSSAAHSSTTSGSTAAPSGAPALVSPPARSASAAAGAASQVAADASAGALTSTASSASAGPGPVGPSAETGGAPEASSLRGRPALRRLSASPARFVNRRTVGRRAGTTLTFFLSAPARIRFTILGKAPDCRPLGAFVRGGRKGVNRVRFLGRLRGRPLPPGRYTLVPEIMRGPGRRALPRVTVVVLSDRLPTGAGETPVRPECVAGTGSGARSAGRRDLDPFWKEAGFAAAPLAAGAYATERGNATAARRESASGVAGVSTLGADATANADPLGNVPIVSSIMPDDAAVPPMMLGISALVAVGLASLILVILVVRFVHRAWNP